MVGPVSRGRTERVGLILVVALGTRAASAAEADVTVRCDELSAEDTAQVEARVRATLLSAGLSPTTVALSCEPASVQTQVTGNGHEVTQRSERSASSLKEALLANAEAALSAWGAASSPALASLPAAAPVLAPAVEPAHAPALAAAPPAPTPNRIPDARPEPASTDTRDRTWLAAGPRAELWSHGWGLGAQVGAQHEFGAVFLAVHAGYLLSVPTSTQFSAHDLGFGAQLGWQPRALLGFRGALGVGFSVFGASPEAGVSAESGKSSTLPCLSVELSRPVEFGAFALLPAAGARAFARARSVQVDGQEVLALPAVALEASLSVALKVGG